MKLVRLAFAAVGLCFVVVNANANTSAMGGIKGLHVVDAYLTLPPPIMKMTAGYMEIQNHSPQDLVLEAVSSPIAGKVEMHHSTTDNGMASMSKLEQLVIPSHSTVRLAPGAMHLMVMALKDKLKTDQSVSLILHFSGQQQVAVEAVVRDMREQQEAPMSGHDHHH